MAKNLIPRGISAGFPRYSCAVVIKALLNSRRGNHIYNWLKFETGPEGPELKFPFLWEFRGISRGKPNVAKH